MAPAKERRKTARNAVYIQPGTPRKLQPPSQMCASNALLAARHQSTVLASGSSVRIGTPSVGATSTQTPLPAVRLPAYHQPAISSGNDSEIAIDSRHCNRFPLPERTSATRAASNTAGIDATK